MVPRIVLGTLALCIYLIAFGCSGQPTQVTEPVYIVNQAALIKSESSLEDQSLELRNCDGKTEHNALADKVQVAWSIMIDDTAISSKIGDSFMLSADTKTLLTEKVNQTYQQMYADARAAVEHTDLTVPSGSIRTFTIYWTRQTISSTISYTQDRQTYSVSYTYTLDIPKATIQMETGCTG